MTSNIAHEISIAGVYFSPLLLVFFLAFALSLATAGILNKLRISQYIIHIPLGFVAILTLYVVLIDAYLIKI